MMIRKILICLLLLLALPVIGQKRKTSTMKPEQQAQKEKEERMVRNTQRIIFIDSMVVDRDQFLQHYRLASEAGRIMRYQDIFHTQQQPNAYVYVNELGNRCYLSQEAADNTINLYVSENIDNRWSRPSALIGINDDKAFHHVNYPYMMGDGQTLYFAADGDEGLGGYDIYVTRYDSETGQFLHPANIGMPFNSTANDYMYVIDEYSNLGWFATDRNQPADKVCIYVFIPPNPRKTYKDTEYTPEQIASFARIDRIADTQCDTLTYEAARIRLNSLQNKQSRQKDANAINFVIDDDVIYTTLSDFKAPGNAHRYQKLAILQNRYQHLYTTLQRARSFYATASHEELNELRPEILASEQKQHELHDQIHNLEKTIRNHEIKYLTKEK